MAIEVAKVELKTVQDASGLEGLIASGKFGADDFHPSDAGYGLWADAVLKVLRREGLPRE